MTRLTEMDISDVKRSISEYDRLVQRKTGMTLRQTACYALDVDEADLLPLLDWIKIGIVPIRLGQGKITGFTESVEAVVKHIGFKTFITHECDVAGITEAVSLNAGVVMMADDRRFIALDLKHSYIADNDEATAKGYIAALDLMSGGIKGQNVLVAGCGPVGRKAALAALKRNARVSLLDIKPQRCQQAMQELQHAINDKVRITIEGEMAHAVQQNRLIIDATNAAGIIDESVITPNTYVAAPGMPLGLTKKAVTLLGDRLYHDPLQTGTAVMVIDAVLIARKENL